MTRFVMKIVNIINNARMCITTLECLNKIFRENYITNIIPVRKDSNSEFINHEPVLQQVLLLKVEFTK